MSEFDLVALGDIADIRMGQSPDSSSYTDDDRFIPFLQGCSDFKEEFPETRIFCSNPGKVAPEGSLLVSIRAPVGTTNIADQEYCIGRGLASVRSGVLPAIYLREVFNLTANFLHRRAQGSTFDAISSQDLRAFPIPIPKKKDRLEQLVDIFQCINLEIRTTQALIDKYVVIKQGMMADLFSRGIDPATGKLRPSATDAPCLYYQTPLGLLPTTWEAVPLKAVCDLQVGFAFKSELFVEEGVSLLRGENVGFGHPIWKERRCLPKQVAEQYNEYRLAVGDLVIGMDRTFTKSGVKISKLDLVDVPSLLVQRVGRFIPFGMVDGLIDHVLKQEQYLRALTIAEQGMDIPHLSKEDILSPLVAVPKCPLEAEMIAKRLKTIQLYIEHEETQKQKLISQKAGLMRDLLTGKVPVIA